MKNEMKKNLFMVAAVALMAMISCNKEDINNGGEPQEPQTPEVVEPSYYVEFTADLGAEETVTPTVQQSATRTTIDMANKNKKTFWVKGDAISVNGKKFVVKELIDGGLSASFVNEGELGTDFKAPYTAKYPYEANGTIEIPESQTAVQGGIDPAYVPAVAYSDDNSLKFKHAASIIKFQVAVACNQVVLSSDDALAGTLDVTLPEKFDEVPTFSAATKTVTVNGPFVTDQDYYLAVLPGTKNNFVVRIDGYLSKNAASVTVNRSTIANMKTLPAPVASDWGLVGVINEWDAESPITMYKDVDDCVLIRNFTGGAFKFIKNKTWNISRGIRSRDASSPSKGTWNLCGTKNISLATGTYDVYFCPKNGVFNYVDAGNGVSKYAPSGKAIYLQVNEWSASDAYFEAWVWGSNQADAWYKFAMAGEKDNNHYVIYVPDGATGIKILRKNPTTASGNWTSWNDSGDQSIPSGKNMFIENGWNNYSWGSYSE